MINASRARCQTPGRQQGVALVISLVLLVTMTILGVATLSGTRLNEKRTANAQQKSIAFEVAESGISSVWSKAYLTGAVTSDAADKGDDPAAIFSDDADTGLIGDFDQLSDGKGVNIEGTVSVQYCGETTNVGSDLSADESDVQLIFMLIDVNSVARVANSSTRADHVQRGAVTSVKTSRTGNCPAP
ncbi:pilus assembly PilX family protein [Granulosicoccus antarcticus]|uniref:Type 4 fimbrial biogenesis protein PilX N-terminal domain-containing protein n=1 Tax=Granulosicoccus antarcticus IMCC3135 TaxID=1192854 RepID=A0A2Z2NYN1_9GAMM|nr:PilX N-terminal domain-containing pilus assembly protein [Granulosicoccus antarcticus]ASJ76556.1 hypothetical protein IMCC3135_32555 [Granulosicoccus antarcticus IMCC3135]